MRNDVTNLQEKLSGVEILEKMLDLQDQLPLKTFHLKQTIMIQNQRLSGVVTFGVSTHSVEVHDVLLGQRL